MVSQLPAAVRDAPESDEGIVRLPAPFPLHHGGVLEAASFAWRLVGPRAAPVVLAIGGISGHRRVAAEDEGWWGTLVGCDRPLDTTRYRVLGIDYLGGSGASTGPAPGRPFPTVSAYDQAEAIARLVAALGLPRLRAIVGASYGGQVALAAGARYPALVERLLVLSACGVTQPMASAWRSVEREMVRFGISHGDAAGGLRLARSLAMCTYRTPREFASRFAGEASVSDGRLRLPIEGYLFARGDAYVARYRPESFVCLSESIDLFRIEAGEVTVPVTAVAVPEDQLVPYRDMQAFVARLAHGRLVPLESIYGHDAFLKEPDALRPVVADVLEGPDR